MSLDVDIRDVNVDYIGCNAFVTISHSLDYHGLHFPSCTSLDW